MMKAMSHRFYQITVAWLDMEEERLTKEEAYQMQLTAEVRRGWVKDPKKVKVEDFRIKLTAEPDKEKSKLSREEKAARDKQFWLALMGTAPNKMKVVNKTKVQ